MFSIGESSAFFECDFTVCKRALPEQSGQRLALLIRMPLLNIDLNQNSVCCPFCFAAFCLPLVSYKTLYYNFVQSIGKIVQLVRRLVVSQSTEPSFSWYLIGIAKKAEKI